VEIDTRYDELVIQAHPFKTREKKDQVDRFSFELLESVLDDPTQSIIRLGSIPLAKIVSVDREEKLVSIAIDRSIDFLDEEPEDDHVCPAAQSVKTLTRSKHK
jgi:hypothetical protein